MRSSTSTFAWLTCVGSMVVVGPMLLAHCSGSSKSIASGDKDGGGGSGSSSGGGFAGSSSGSSDDGGGSSSGGTSSGGSDDGGSSGSVSDGGTGGGEGGSSGGSACQTPEGGAACDPGTVPCGSASCSTATQYCCSNGDGGGTCDPYNGGSCASGVKVSCNEATDCASGVCCEPDQFGPQSTSCMPSCPAGNFQVCRTDSECGGGDSGAPHKCIVQKCPTGPGAGAGTITVQACAYFTAGGGFAGGGGGTYGPLPLCTAE